MSIEQVKRLLKQKENIRLEFKEAQHALPTNLFETICAMLNRDGGDILLGVTDNAELQGVEPTAIEKITREIVTLSNNPNKLDPPHILFPLVHAVNKKTVIHIQVPASSQLHKSASAVYDRSADGHFVIKQPHQIAEIYNRKRTHYTEGIIYPKIRFTDFKQDLFPKVRNLIKSNVANHPWLSLTDKQILERAGLWKKDYQSGKEGYTLAAVLLFGKDEVIQQILPHYKTDALLRVKNIHRYDDREYIQTNLIESYDKLMDFVAKHLPDKFYKEGNQRKSLRTDIFHEVVANILVHREYTNAHPATFVIHPDRVETENANNPNGHGPIILGKFTPFSKNPTVAKFFIQLGLVEELGSGFLNVNRFVKEYGGKRSPEFIEGNTFKMVIPISEKMMAKKFDGAGVSGGAVEGLIEGLTEGLKQKLINLIKTMVIEEGKRIPFYANKISEPEKNIERYFKLFRDKQLIEYRGSKKTGGYFLTEEIKKKLKQ
ncbi:MAG: putative DNA binding domain-containing protein [Bacteroidota bacterium]|nr:putative DNA binding domain-containing protein [Bacteroidota bacterium]